MLEAKYPECEKLQAVASKSQVIGEFLEWLHAEKNLVVCKFGKWNGDEERPLRIDDCRAVNTIESLLAEFFDIDVKKLEAERRQMVDAIQDKQR